MTCQGNDDEEKEEASLLIPTSSEGKHLICNNQDYNKAYGIPSYHHLAECINEFLSFITGGLKLNGGLEELSSGYITRCMCFTISSIWETRIFHLIKLQSQRICDIMLETLSIWASLRNAWVLEDDL